MKQYFITDQGKVRPHNEDAGGLFKNKADQTLSIVADGMGGHQAGDVASEMVKTYFANVWEATERIATPEEAEAWLKSHILKANTNVFQHAEQNPECRGMGTTVIVVIFMADQLSIAHIGDSRCYRYREDDLTQITDDHSLVNELVRSGQLSKQDAEYHPRKNVLMKALGTNPLVEPDVFSVAWQEGDRLIICSDGLTNKLTDQELKDYLATNESLRDIAKEMVNEANDRGGEDNITLALAEHSEAEEGDATC
ncbi:Stp1/IreP family PP2C-type Ser/Thr phosphatase [Amphibacillus cookii]|uniref:Stp1/IreP family PP2C-type Ser/Thr phosphatase n=1 Tax=Amphibacillus cookii TaxID=767787 RepID=UPI00195CFDFD|nr:Stp1/IreP family PP2C-type Ser/Thr phosphatase [Amphibacillus cookii]MBM7540527.1 protein phosphatase [Amphibacillus cookii]